MRIRLLGVFLLALLFRAPGLADTVFLTNGRSFEGVIAEVTDGAVRIQMPGGSLSLPRSHVLRVEKSESDFAEYLRRQTALKRAGAPASDWLGLARWARSQGLEQGAREAALAAADLDPHLEGLAPLLRGFGYVFDDQLERWVAYSDYMRRRGFVQSGGQWISREEQAARQREDLARRNAERAAARAEAVNEAQLTLAETALRQQLYANEAASAYALPFYGIPWYAPVPARQHKHHGPHATERQPAPHQPAMGHASGSFMHVPGSLIPGTFGGANPR